jgi:hypothetical protein
MTRPLPEASTLVSRWREIFRTKRYELLPELLDENIVFRSPILDSPQEGKEKVAPFLAMVLSVLSDVMNYQREWYATDSVVLEFTGELDGTPLQGTEILRWNDSGLVEELTVLGRPLAALQLVNAKVQQMLAEA